MNTKFKICLLSALLMAPIISIAMPSNQPKYCPGFEAIKSVPVTKAEYSSMGGWIAYNPNKNRYDTSEEWTFLIMLGSADTESDAIAKANQDIALIERVYGPEQKDKSDEWSCFYFGGGEDVPSFLALAVTPPYVPLAELAAGFKHRACSNQSRGC